MHLNHATATAINYQHYPPPQISTHGVTPTTVQQHTTLATGLQQNPFTLHQLTAVQAVQAIQHPTHQAMLHPQHPLVTLLDISSTTTTPNPTALSPTPKVEVQLEEKVHVDDPRKKKECHICKTKFRQLTTLRNHMKIHTDERPYKCKHCEKAFRQISTLTNHVKIHTGEKPFTCNICAKDFRQQSTLINHIKTHKESSQPPTLVNYHQDTKVHIRQKGPHGQSSAQYHNRAISKNLYTGSYSSPQADALVKPFECNVCKKRFPQLSTLHNHERTHLDPKPYKCETCDKCFTQLATLTNHKKIHSGDKPYACSFCSMHFRQQSTLTNHMKTHATAAANNHNHAAAAAAAAAQAAAAAAGAINQRNAMAAPLTAVTHAGGLNMPTAAQATAIIAQNSQLNANAMLHQQLQVEHPLLHFLDTNTTVSAIVPKEYYTNGSNNNNNNNSSNNAQQQLNNGLLGKPKPNNTGEYDSKGEYKGECPDRPFVCTLCRRAFAQQSTLTNHIKTHTGEKPFKCKICEANFRQLSTLNNHMKIHTGEKPFSCTFCPKLFRQKSTLNNHVRIHTC